MPLALDLISTLVMGSTLPVATTLLARSPRSTLASLVGSILVPPRVAAVTPSTMSTRARSDPPAYRSRLRFFFLPLPFPLPLATVVLLSRYKSALTLYYAAPLLFVPDLWEKIPESPHLTCTRWVRHNRR